MPDTKISTPWKRLAHQFADCQREIDHSTLTPSDRAMHVDRELYAAGRLLFDVIQEGTIDLGKLPRWFYVEPEGEDEMSCNADGDCRAVLSFDLYWLCGIRWIAENRPDSVLSFPYGFIQLETPKCLYEGEDIYRHLDAWEKHTNLRARREFARISEQTCDYLNDLLPLEDITSDGSPPKDCRNAETPPIVLGQFQYGVLEGLSKLSFAQTITTLGMTTWKGDEKLGRDEKTLREAIQVLEGHDFVHRPWGKKSGVAITPEGRAYLDSLQRLDTA